jgi:hypothetical protein
MHPPSTPTRPVRARHCAAAPAIALALFAGMACAQGFKFGGPDPSQEAGSAAQARPDDRMADALSTPCRRDLQGKKIMLVIGERQSDGFVVAEQKNYGPHFQAINARLRSLGLRTHTPEEIRAQIKQAEIDAYFRNDPDAALAAARRNGASFILRGLITSDARPNPLMAVNEVSVAMGFTLTQADGKVVSDVSATAASYAGANIGQTALALVNEQADRVVAKLYGDYCRHAGFAPAPPGKPK